jgi:hypothetical protein
MKTLTITPAAAERMVAQAQQENQEAKDKRSEDLARNEATHLAWEDEDGPGAGCLFCFILLICIALYLTGFILIYTLIQ